MVVFALVAACQAGLLHHAPAVSSQNIVRHDQSYHHEAPVHYTAVHAAPIVHAVPIEHSAPAYHVAPIEHSAPAYHVAPVLHHAAPAVHAAPAHHDDHHVDEYVRFITIDCFKVLVLRSEITDSLLIILIQSRTGVEIEPPSHA